MSETVRFQKAKRAKKTDWKSKLYRCKLCNKLIPPADVLQHFELHKKIADQSGDVTNEADVVFQCPVCPKQFWNRKGYDSHVKIFHQTKDFACETCKETFQMEYQLAVHLAQHSNNPNLFVCLRCNDFSTEDQSHLKSHFNNAHYTDTNLQFYCNVCKRYFFSRGWFDSHEVFHVKQNRKLFCEFCKTFLQDSPDYKSHMMSVHNIRSTKGYKCEQCNVTFPAYKNYQRHEELLHRPPVALLCTVCGKAFERKGNLAMHMQIHEEGKHVCQVCGKRFKKAQGLTMHARTHTGERPYKCNVCAKSFTQRSAMLVHMRIHTGKRPFSCDRCGKGFVTKAAHRNCCR